MCHSLGYLGHTLAQSPCHPQPLLQEASQLPARLLAQPVSPPQSTFPILNCAGSFKTSIALKHIPPTRHTISRRRGLIWGPLSCVSGARAPPTPRPRPRATSLLQVGAAQLRQLWNLDQIVFSDPLSSQQQLVKLFTTSSLSFKPLPSFLARHLRPSTGSLARTALTPSHVLRCPAPPLSSGAWQKPSSSQAQRTSSPTSQWYWFGTSHCFLHNSRA